MGVSLCGETNREVTTDLTASGQRTPSLVGATSHTTVFTCVRRSARPCNMAVTQEAAFEHVKSKSETGRVTFANAFECFQDTELAADMRFAIGMILIRILHAQKSTLEEISAGLTKKLTADIVRRMNEMIPDEEGVPPAPSMAANAAPPAPPQ